MTDDRLEPPAEVPPRKGAALLAWVVILGVVTAVVWWQNRRPARDPAEAPAERLSGLGGLKVQGRYLVGAASLYPSQREKFYKEARALDRGPVGQRLRFAVLAGELAGPREALNRLGDLSLAQASPAEREVARLLERLYAA